MASVRKGIERRLARLSAVRARLREVAAEVLDAARRRALAHRDSGALADSLDVDTGRVDVQVVASDPRAVSKEYGHTDGRTGRHIAGLHVLGGAAADVAARR